MYKTIQLTVAISCVRFSTMASRRPPITAIKICSPPPSKVFRSEISVVLQTNMSSCCIEEQPSNTKDILREMSEDKVDTIPDSQTADIASKNEVLEVSLETDANNQPVKQNAKSNKESPRLYPNEPSSSLSLTSQLTESATLSSSSDDNCDRLVSKGDDSAGFIQKTTQYDISSDQSIGLLGDSISPNSNDLKYISNPPIGAILVSSFQKAASFTEAQNLNVAGTSDDINDKDSGVLLSKFQPVIKQKQILPTELLEKVTNIKHQCYDKTTMNLDDRNTCIKDDSSTIDTYLSDKKDHKSRTQKDSVKDDKAQTTKATIKQRSGDRPETSKNLQKSHQKSKSSGTNNTETLKDLKSLTSEPSLNDCNETRVSKNTCSEPLKTEVGAHSMTGEVKTKRRRRNEDKCGTKMKQKYSESDKSVAESGDKIGVKEARSDTHSQHGSVSHQARDQRKNEKKTKKKRRNTNENALLTCSSDKNNDNTPTTDTKPKAACRSSEKMKQKDKLGQDHRSIKTRTDNSSSKQKVDIIQIQDVDNEAENCIPKISLDALLTTPTKNETDVYDLSKLFDGSLDAKYEKWKKRENRKAKKKEKSDQHNEERKEKRKRPNYFVSIQITNPKITNGVAAVQNCMCKENEHLKSAMISLATLHLTLRVGCLENQEHISRMIKALDECVNKFNNENEDAIIMSVKDIGHFGNNVVFAQVQKDEGHIQLTRVSEILEECCQCYDVPPTDKKGFTPHITIAKLSKSHFRHKYKDKIKKKLEPSTYAEFKNRHFGRQLVTSLQLCSMQKPKDKAGYYHVTHVTQNLQYRQFSTLSEANDNITDVAHVIVASAISMAIQILKQETSKETAGSICVGQLNTPSEENV